MLVHEDFFSPNSYFSTWFLTPRWCWEGNTSTACPQRNTSLPPSTCTWTSSISSSLSCPLLATLGIRSRAKGYAVQRGQGFFTSGFESCLWVTIWWISSNDSLLETFLLILYSSILFSNEVYCKGHCDEVKGNVF